MKAWTHWWIQEQPSYVYTTGKYSLAALMKLLWYWYVMSGAGNILKTPTRTRQVKGASLESDTTVIVLNLFLFPLFWTSAYHFYLRTFTTASQWCLNRGADAVNYLCVVYVNTDSPADLSVNLSIYSMCQSIVCVCVNTWTSCSCVLVSCAE